MKFRIACLLLLFLSGCMSTTWFSEHYDKKYTLKQDSYAHQCSKFTSRYTLWFGIDDVLCLSIDENQSDFHFRKGSTVNIIRIFSIGAVDAHYNTAELEVVSTSGITYKDIYVRWPDGLSLIQEENND